MPRSLLFISAVIALSVAGGTAAFAETSLTVYNRDLALVKDTRDIVLEKKQQKLELNDVASRIDPTSVRFSLLSAPGRYTLLEQNFEYDLVNREKLLQKYVGRDIEIERTAGRDGERKETLRGTLLSADGGLIVRSGERIVLAPEGTISLGKLPEGLILKPTLSLLIDSQVSGTQKAEIDYLTEGVNWNADYVAVTSKDDKALDLTGWVTVSNRSGVSYPDAQLKLVAGDVNRVAQDRETMAAEGGLRMMKAAAPQFEEQGFFEYHLYTLQRRTTVNNNETKQIEFITAGGVPAKKTYIYDGTPQFRRGFAYQAWSRADRNFGAGQNTKVNVMLEFKNAKESRLGMPLPQGRVRVYREDDDGALEFAGEDAIDHTPRDENVRLSLGNAFDIVGERVQTNFACGDDWCEESFRITVRNHKDTPVSVKAVEHLYRWSNWKITARSDNFTKTDSRTIEYALNNIPANGEKTVTYTVRYSW